MYSVHFVLDEFWTLIFHLVFVSCAQNKEVISLRDDHDHLVEMKTEVQRLHAVEQDNKRSTDRIAELERIIAQLTTDLEREILEKESAVRDKVAIKEESELVENSFCFFIFWILCVFDPNWSSVYFFWN